VPMPWPDELFRIPASIAAGLGVSPWIVIVVAAALIALGLARLAPLPADDHHWRWTTTGLLLGALGVLAWLTGAPAGWHWGLSVIGPSRSLVEIVGGNASAATWGRAMGSGGALG